MKTKKKILVLTDDMPWGHRSIARAIFDYLKKNERESGYTVEIAEIKAETVFISDLYVLAYRYVPISNKLAHRASGTKMGRKILREVSILNLNNIKEKISQVDPDLIISTYFLHSHSLAYWREKKQKKFKLWSVVPDPWTINPMSFVPNADLNLVYDGVGVKKAIENGVDKNKIFKTGWWTRQEMYNDFDREISRKKIGVFDERPIIFVGGGSLGTNSWSKLLPVILTLKSKVALVFNTGTDKLAYKMVNQFIGLLKRLKRDKTIIIKNFGWIDNMAEVLSACDIVFGKAGPNFLFDVVATKKPFVAITHIGGQEDGNIDLILKKRLGWVREKNFEMIEFFLEYLKNPNRYNNKFLKNIEKEGSLNKKSLQLILKKIKDEI